MPKTGKKASGKKTRDEKAPREPTNAEIAMRALQGERAFDDIPASPEAEPPPAPKAERSTRSTTRDEHRRQRGDPSSLPSEKPPRERVEREVKR